MSHQLVAFRCMVSIWTIVPTNRTNRMSTMSSKLMLLGRMQCRLSLFMVMLRPVKREEQLLLVFNRTSDHLCSLLRYIINRGHPIDNSRELTATATATATRTAKKLQVFISKTTLHVHHAFLYISLPSLHDYNVRGTQRGYSSKPLKIALLNEF